MKATLTLPWPNKDLSPNARVHWGRLARAKKKAKQDAHIIALEAKLGKIQADEIRVTLSFHPPGAYAFDDDGLSSRMKAALDGISQAIGVDDSRFRLGPIGRGPIEKNGLVKVELEWNEKQEEAAA